MLILGIETSCDETGVALYDSERGLLADVLHSQTDLHATYGGVVPELASRDHIRKITPLVEQLLAESATRLSELDGVAYTAGPGLIGALMVGAGFGQSLAWSLDIPALGVHHMEGHLLAPLMDESVSVDMPFLALLVSGGHTQLVRVDQIGEYELLGESLDDAAGEAFDKAAKLLDLGFPGGPHLARCAEAGDPKRFRFPRPMTDRPGLDFSFSGLKTFTLNTINAHSASGGLKSASGDLKKPEGALNPKDQADIARAFEEAVVDTMLIKCRRALDQTGIDTLLMAGGVSANVRLRERLAAELSATVIYPPARYCTDNGAMIAHVGALRMAAGERSPLGVAVRARWPLTELSKPGSG